MTYQVTMRGLDHKYQEVFVVAKTLQEAIELAKKLSKKTTVVKAYSIN